MPKPMRDLDDGISLNAALLCLIRPAGCLKTDRKAPGVPCPLQKEAENRGERYLFPAQKSMEQNSMPPRSFHPSFETTARRRPGRSGPA